MTALSHESCTFIFEGGNNQEFLISKILKFKKDFENFSYHTAYFGDLNQVLAGTSPDRFETLNPIKINNWQDLIGVIKTPFLAFLPGLMDYSSFVPENVVLDDRSINPWVPFLDLPSTEGARTILKEVGWIGPTSLLKTDVGSEKSLSLRAIQSVIEKSNLNIRYRSAEAGVLSSNYSISNITSPKILTSSSVLAVVPHFNCNDYLEQCLQSLVSQTRLLDGIVVVDDGSDVLPVETVKKFKEVTLLKSPLNVGPYRLIQQVINESAYDAYLFQDADDWSSCDRLEILLCEAERTGAELIGTQELMFFGDSISSNRYPLDVHGALAKGPSYALLHPSSLVSRDLIQRIGGYSTGLKFSGDLEFLNRAVHAGRVQNVNSFSYFRRMRKDSLTLSPVTGLASLARTELHHRIRTKAYENLKKISGGLLPNIVPLEVGEPVQLEWITGPTIHNG